MQGTAAPRICSVEGCETPLRATNTIGRCREHAYIPAAGAICGADGCNTVLRKDFSGRIFKPRTCPDCGDDFTPHSANDKRCPECQHAHRLALRAEREGRNDRDTCSVPGCGAKLRTSNTTGRCSDHRYYAGDRPVCAVDGCGEPLRKDNTTGFCKRHKFATDRIPVRTCAADGCDGTLRADNQSGYCSAHASQTAGTRASRDRYYARLREESAERYEQRPLCSVDGCANRLRSDNNTGRCVEHLYIPMEWDVCSVDGCGTRIKPDNTLGRCTEHRSLYWAGDAPVCGDPGCDRTLHRDNLTGFCQEHRSRGEYNRRCYNRNAAAMREYARQYRRAHPEEHRAAASAWNAANRMARLAAEARRKLAAAAGMDDFDRELSVAYRLAILRDPCFYCGSPVTAHVDHYFPLAKGGSDHWWNLVRACQPCNNAKYAMCGTAFLLLTGG